MAETSIRVAPVRSWGDQRRFLDLPWRLYRDDPHWVPPLRRNQAELVGFHKHPFHEVAEVQAFLAWRGAEVVGRIVAIHDREFIRMRQEQIGFWGFFESQRDPQVVAALFDTVRRWHAERGLTALRGPVNPSMNYECGLLIEGFDSAPTFLMTYNPSWYPELIEGYGFRKVHDLFAYYGHKDQLAELRAKMGHIAEGVRDWCQAEIRPLDRGHFLRDVQTFLELYNSSLTHMWGFVPLTEAEMRHLARTFKYLVVPKLSLFAIVDGKPVGAVIALPDYNPRIKKIGGRLFPFGWLTLLAPFRDIRRARSMSIAVVPEYQRLGLGVLLLDRLIPTGLALGMVDVEFSWVSETNDLSRKSLERGGAKLYKRYRLYDLDPSLAPPPP